MTEQVDLDALISEARDIARHGNGPQWESDAEHALADLADALESTLAELRQERERADAAERALRATDDYRVADWQKLELERDEAEAALSRAEETIDRIDGEVKNFEQSDNDALCEIERLLTEYDKQKGAERG